MGDANRSLGRRPAWWKGSRTRLARWLLALVLALGAATLVAGRSRDAADTVAGLGLRRSVAVARHDLDPGHVISAGDLTVRSLPVLAIAPGTLAGDAAGRTVTARILAGELVNEARVAPGGVSGLTALVPPGRRGVSVPRPADGSGLAVQPGDEVDVLFGDDVGSDGRPTVAAEGATVIDVRDAAVTLAVRADETAGVAAAVGRGVPVLALIGAESAP